MKISAINVCERRHISDYNCKPRAVRYNSGAIYFQGNAKEKAIIALTLVSTSIVAPHLIPQCAKVAKQVFFDDDNSDNREKTPR